MDTELRNWAGNYCYSTNRIATAASTAEAQEYLQKQAKLKVLGTRHSFNGIADSDQTFLSLEEMNQIVTLDEIARTVTVGTGMTYARLSPHLHDCGFALHNLASLPHISIAGACATATHGSGMKNGNLATAVSALKIVTPGQGTLSLSRDKDGSAFQGAVVHLGALGVVTEITLDVEPTFIVGQDVYENLPMSQVQEHFEEIMSAGYSVSLFTDWQARRINQVWVKRRITDRLVSEAAPQLYGAKLATRNLHPIGELPAENCTAQLGVPGPWFERLPHFKAGFKPSSGDELQSEYFVPLRNAVDAILSIERMRDQIRPHLLISELRTIDADELWMSPCYKRASLGMHFTWKNDWDSVRRILPLIEKELTPFLPRPHWGKLFTMAPVQLQSCYEKLSEFRKLLEEFDPTGYFHNEFLTTYVLA